MIQPGTDSPMRAAQLELWDLYSTQRELDRAIEFLPRSTIKRDALIKRAAIRSREEIIIKPLWDNLMSVLDGAGTLHGIPEMTSPLAFKLSDSILKYAPEFNKIEKELIYSISLVGNDKTITSHPMSGILDWFSSTTAPDSMTYASEDTIPAGKKALTYFHDRASQYPDYPYSNVDELASHYIKNYDNFYDSLGLAILSIGEFLTDSKVEDTMILIADKGQGKVPQNMTVFFSKLGEVASNPSVLDSIPFILAEGSKQVASAAESLGESTVSSLKSLNLMWKYLPWIAAVGGGIYLYTFLPKRKSA